ncbi:MAG: FtsX-like permease family protein [Gammaproteobacteria bacterium]|nr:ABC transporter permease [Gammaproteobacteria bacterium]NNC97192.1 FtsX-like permease family protein [Gammaproteobacteria bacterium]NNM14498.1 FtsX-like permease family protein [Gammaproteobacteria bacterium]
MKLGVALSSALEALLANPLRSFLTMLGIMIGVASVMAMMSISQGAAKQVDEQISALGASILTARPGASRRGGRSTANSAPPFNDKLLEALKNEPYANAVGARNSGSGTLVAGDVNWTSSIYGVNTDYFIAQAWGVSQGEIFNAKDVRSGAAVAVIGQTTADTLFEGTNPIGQSLRANNVPLRVIGVLNKKGQSSWGGDRDDIVIIPLNTARNRVIGAHPTTPKHIERIEVSVRSGYDMAETQNILEERLRELRRIKPGGSDNFRVYNVADFIRARSSTQATMGILLAFTAAVSLIVGGVGVMNIMLVSVTERTREIGLRMAVGARKNDILGQFLTEAIALCLIGGLIGSVLGVGAANLAAELGDFPVTITSSIALVSLSAAAIIGIFFGFFPARRAAQLNPIDALRSE